MRKLNKTLLEQWLNDNGHLAKEDLAHYSRIGFYKLRRIIVGEKDASELEQKAICKATRLKRDDLFPLIK